MNSAWWRSRAREERGPALRDSAREHPSIDVVGFHSISISKRSGTWRGAQPAMADADLTLACTAPRVRLPWRPQGDAGDPAHSAAAAPT